MQLIRIIYALIPLDFGKGGIGIRVDLGPVGGEQLGLLGRQLLEGFI